MDNLLTTKELQDWLKVSRFTVHNWRSEGLPYLKIGRSVRFDKDAVKEWLLENQKVHQ